MSSMGDIVLTTPVIRMLKNQKSARIHYLLKRQYASILENNPHIEKLIFWEDCELRELRSEHYDLVIDLHKTLRSLWIKINLGSPITTYNKNWFRTWLFLYLKIDRLRRIHIVERYLDCLKNIDLVNDKNGLELFTGNKYEIRQLAKSRKLVVVNLGGTYLTKRIPSHIIAPLVSGSSDFHVLLGGDDVQVDLEEYDNCLNLIGKTTLAETMSIIEQCDLVVTGDSGLMHIAASFQKPIIVIWGSTGIEFGFWPYFGESSNQTFVSMVNHEIRCNPCSKYGRKKCPKGHMKCLTYLLPQRIAKHVEHFLRPQSM